MNPRTVLQERYPQADFWEYFRFLGECKGTMPSGRTNEHHICPEKQFPEYKGASENLITLTLEDHAYAHELLGAAVPELRISTSWIRKQSDVKSLWEDPDYRARCTAASTAALSTLEAKAQASAHSKKNWADPQVRARRSAAIRAAVNSPDTKEKRREATRAGVIAWHARRRAERLELCHV